MNVINLRTLANYLLSGELKADFNMRHYDSHNQILDGVIDCGSCGCALGHGPYAGVVKSPWESWAAYSRRAMGMPNGSIESIWCFSMQWTEIDNTAQGAGKRILWMLEHGVPVNWMRQIDGLDPLCYLDKESK